jgi:hypothetical protein
MDDCDYPLFKDHARTLARALSACDDAIGHKLLTGFACLTLAELNVFLSALTKRLWLSEQKSIYRKQHLLTWAICRASLTSHLVGFEWLCFDAGTEAHHQLTLYEYPEGAKGLRYSTYCGTSQRGSG